MRHQTTLSGFAGGLALALAVAACSSAAPDRSASPAPSGSPSASASAEPSASATPSPEGPLTVPQLKYALMDRLGRPWFCDPDYYPIAREDEQQLAIQRFGEVRTDADAFAAILSYLDLDADTGFTDEHKLAIYREWKTLNAILLEDSGDGGYRFDLLTVPPPGGAQGTRTAGTIDDHGGIQIEQQVPAGEPPCPICLAPGTLIDTPTGPHPVESLGIGSPIWTLDALGRRVASTVSAVGSTRVPATHRLVHLVLDDGRELRASPGHPLFDGRTVGELEVGDVVNGARVVATDLVASAPSTFDILPSGDTGAYWAGGIPLRSTLGP